MKICMKHNQKLLPAHQVKDLFKKQSVKKKDNEDNESG